jgi:predicted glutamine amidotransferase
MCRMIAMIGQPPLPANEAMAAFFPLCADGRVKSNMAKGHLDGWGVSGFSGGRAVYFERRAQPACEEKELFDRVAGRALQCQTPLLVAHFRKASTGGREDGNTHPFHWRDWVFAHNGTIFNAATVLALEEARPQGQTDSERFGLWLLEQAASADNPTEALASLLREGRGKLAFSSLNFLMSNGKTLWAYREVGDQRLEKGETLEERENYYTLHFGRVGKAAVVCSEPLPSLTKSWSPLEQSSLAVFTSELPHPQLIKI